MRPSPQNQTAAMNWKCIVIGKGNKGAIMTPSLFFNDPVGWAAPQNSFVFIYSVESNPICSTNFLFHNNPSYFLGKSMILGVALYRFLGMRS